jgi:hypothetical protein
VITIEDICDADKRRRNLWTRLYAAIAIIDVQAVEKS